MPCTVLQPLGALEGLKYRHVIEYICITLLNSTIVTCCCVMFTVSCCTDQMVPCTVSLCAVCTLLTWAFRAWVRAFSSRPRCHWRVLLWNDVDGKVTGCDRESLGAPASQLLFEDYISNLTLFSRSPSLPSPSAHCGTGAAVSKRLLLTFYQSNCSYVQVVLVFTRGSLELC